MNHPDNLNIINDLMPPEIRDRMRTRSVERPRKNGDITLCAHAAVGVLPCNTFLESTFLLRGDTLIDDDEIERDLIAEVNNATRRVALSPSLGRPSLGRMGDFCEIGCEA